MLKLQPKGATVNALIDLRERIVRGDSAGPPVAQLIGFTMTDAEPRRAVIELEAGERHHNPMGTVHGGIITDIADAAMGVAYATTLAEGESFTTVELKVNFLRQVREGKLRAEGRVVNRGRTLGLVECDVTDEDGRLVARASSTCMTLRAG
jgi:uncharacterized protein (TIGR00369 family)